ncbi:hypothetical protein BKA62DRAFT_829753 [Auriculariales sp. MPI-PUGE-AT-0066]|nr:hypothetical protein BKA62DRAFT_829753 [Auriculariales sp. MPI-PUGE-AT-0066]
MTADATDSWLRSVRDRTHEYNYCDSTVHLRVKHRNYRVSIARLTSISPVFEDLFSMPKADQEPIELNHDVDEFEWFLWYLHASHIEFADFMANSDHHMRLACITDIGSMAHFYQCSAATYWAISEILKLLPVSGIGRNLTQMKRLLSFAHRCSDHAPQLLDMARDSWCSKSWISLVPSIALREAKMLDDTYLQARCYFIILQYTSAKIREDKVLTDLDRLRLNIGATNLRKYENIHCCGYARGHVASCFKMLAAGQDNDDWSPNPRAPLQDMYGDVSLWDMFNRSSMGLDLSELTIRDADQAASEAEVSAVEATSDS